MITLVSSVNDSDHLFTMLEYSFTIAICLYKGHRFNLICITSTIVVTANASTVPVKFGFAVQFSLICQFLPLGGSIGTRHNEQLPTEVTYLVKNTKLIT